MKAAHHGVGQPLAELLRADEPPARLHPGIELLEVFLCQLVQGDLPQLRNDVLIDLRFVVGLGGGTDLGFYIFINRFIFLGFPSVLCDNKWPICVAIRVSFDALA